MSEPTFKCATCGCEHSVALSTPTSDPDYYTRQPDPTQASAARLTAPPSREAEIAARLALVGHTCNEYSDIAEDDLRHLLAQLQQALTRPCPRCGYRSTDGGSYERADDR